MLQEFKVVVQKVQEEIQKVRGLLGMPAAAVQTRAHAISNASTNACNNNNNNNNNNNTNNNNNNNHNTCSYACSSIGRGLYGV